MAARGARAAGGDAEADRVQPTRTAKERLGRKASDDQRLDNCKVPPDLRGRKPRPERCGDGTGAKSAERRPWLKLVRAARRRAAPAKRARQNGIKFGRTPKLSAYQRQEALERLAQGESQSTIARTFNVDRATVPRLARR